MGHFDIAEQASPRIGPRALGQNGASKPSYQQARYQEHLGIYFPVVRRRLSHRYLEL